MRSCTAAVLALSAQRVAQTGKGVFAVDAWNADGLEAIVASIQPTQ
ncbi:MAG: hypothetical protein WBR10_08430 [Candidatus Acidiferrum sp.]